MRLNKVVKELNVGLPTIVDFLNKKGYKVETNPNAKISQEMYDTLLVEFNIDSSIKKKSAEITLKINEHNTTISIDDINKKNNKIEEEEEETEIENDIIEQNELIIKDNSKKPVESQIKIVGKIDLKTANKPKTKKSKETPIDELTIVKEKTHEFEIEKIIEEEEPEIETKNETEIYATKINNIENNIKIIGKLDLASINQKTKPDRKTKKEKQREKELKKIKKQEEISKIKENVFSKKRVQKNKLNEKKDEQLYRTNTTKLNDLKILGKIEINDNSNQNLDKKRQPAGSSADYNPNDKHKKKRKRILVKTDEIENKTTPSTLTKPSYFKGKGKKRHIRNEIDNVEVDRSIKDTIATMATGKGKTTTSKYRREKREAVNKKLQNEINQQEKDKNILKITEFVSVNELATLMNVPANEVIATCMNLGLFVSINQRLDAESLSVIADEFGYKIEFITVEVQSDIIENETDKPEDLIPRPPIITVMGHVDHGKTKLLDYIRNTNVVAGEAGGITQHIGAYSVKHVSGRMITFLDTPGHEAFTAMRARGAQLTDVAIIVIAADDGVKPQTVEAINHAQAANVPMVFAINKIDKPGANPDKIREELSGMNLLVEEWGGKYQSQEIAAKPGTNVNLLLDKVILEADLLELKANPNRDAVGVVIESSLDKGRGYVSNLLVNNGTLHVGDIVLAGSYHGKIKAMFNERNQKLTEAGPSLPVQILGLNGAPQAGDKFNVIKTEQIARETANKRMQIIREQGLRTQKHITLEEIGRRLAIGNFKELNVIVKGDVDGSIEALSDSLIKLSNEEIQVNVIHKAVGQISESDIMLAAASNAVIIGFQVRPSVNARKLAEKEEIQIRLYSIIYDAIDEIKQAMEGMLSPVIKEEIIGSAEIRQVFKIGKVGTVAGCMVNEGKIYRTSKIRVIRDGIVVFTGELGSLKRFKEDVKDVASGLECGLNIERFNDINEGDIVEAFKETEVKKKL
ncbi:MAG: translation initiation factor IF-2 [Bacteroidetes bacterium CG02_land_8_20_14_3_00_31_25]|nr:translation initiation factor IF-2 [Bacteroidota bacterium]PIV57723.1 MAG: translation initiation factor IF-2 [Bacteroidetes bacterium CG02_land_8_20_14_3_00_31_25]